jgi:hypothetical protein
MNIFVCKSAKDIEELDGRAKDGYSRHALRQTVQPNLGQNSQLQLMPFQVCHLVLPDKLTC